MATGLDQFDDQRTGSEFFTQRLVQVLEHRQSRIPSCQVSEFQRSHRVSERHTLGGVDILCTGNALRQHVHGLIAK